MGASERAQLEATIRALRAQLEREAADHNAAMEDAAREFRIEREQLVETIASLRERLEVVDVR